MNFMGWYIVGMGLLMIFLTEIMFISDFGVYTGVTYQQYFISDQIFAEIFILQKKVMGFMVCGVGALVLFIVRMGYRKGDKWAWFALLIAGCLVWGAFIGYKLIIMYYGGSMITFVVGAVLRVLGLIFPSKELLRK